MFKEVLIKNIDESIHLKNKFLQEVKMNDHLSLIIETILNCYKDGGKLYIAGNGGSAADAQHMAAEFVSRFNFDRDPLPAEALTVDSSILTAIGNDYNFDKIFSRQIKAKMSKKDIFLAISTSGCSQNIIEALLQCKNMGIQSILLTGENGGIAKEHADYSICAYQFCI